MKILFGIQGTGNGHMSRAKAVIPHLQQYGEVDILISSTETEVKLPYNIRYKKYGMGFLFGTKGGIDIFGTLKQLKPIQFIKDIRDLDVKSYDIIFNDYEPIVAWACKLKGMTSHGLSHQGAFLSQKSPRPKNKRWYGEFILKNYAPTTTTNAFHFDRYDDFIHTPVIRSGIRNTTPTQKNHVAVYLPALGDSLLINTLSKIKETHWEVFSKRAKEVYTEKNVTIHPVSGVKWEKTFASCEGALMGAGFEGDRKAHV